MIIKARVPLLFLISFYVVRSSHGESLSIILKKKHALKS